jgi:hypothetical protein
MIETEFGDAEVDTVLARNALKEFICPCCDEFIEVGEEHKVVVPEVAHRQRRHVHKDCFEEHDKRNLRIVLHPNDTKKDFERYV